MSSPAEQLASIKSVPNQKRDTSQPNVSQLQTDADVADQSSIANQATEDADLLNAQAQSIDNAPVNADQPVTDADVMVGKKNIAAARASIFANPDTAVVPQNTDSPPVALDGAEALNAAQNSIYAGQVDDAPRETAAIPLPDASKVSEVQDLALAGMEIPAELEQQVASADALIPADVADPQLAQQALELTPTTPTLEDAEAQDVAVAAVEERVQPVRKRRTLADFFSNSANDDGFDKNRFAQKPRRRLNTNAIPNMQTAALGEEQLPGVNANALFSTGNLSEDEHTEDDDQPAGLMKLASLSGMTRAAPDGLWTQTDKVEVRCLRPQLVSMLKSVEDHYKRPVVVTSGFRDTLHNRRVGGVRHSLHTLCAAADIQVQGVSKWALADYLRSIPGRGGVGTYCHTDSVHIDIGGERDWNWRCRRKKTRRG